MLLIDSRGRISAVTEALAPVPFIYVRAELGIERMCATLVGIDHDPLSLRALREAMRQATGDIPAQAPFPASLIRAIGRAVTTGLIKVAFELPHKISVRFDLQRPRGSAAFDTAVFSRRQIAIAYLAELLAEEGNVSAFDAALACPEGELYLAHGTKGSDRAAHIASLLVSRYLILKPIEFFPRRYRLLWIEDYGTFPLTTASPAEHVPRAARRPPTPGSRSTVTSTLPDPPEGITPQAQALIDAAQHGVPFCEECTKAPMEAARA